MNTKIKIDKDHNRIRQLIANWYDGCTSPTEEKEIVDFFADTDPVKLPDDLCDEASVFTTIGSISSMCPDKEFLAEIDATVKAEMVPERKKLTFVYWLSAVAVAASLSLLLFTGVRFDKASLATRSNESKIAVNVDNDTTVVEEQQQVDSEDAVPSVEQIVVFPQNRQKTELVAVVNDGYREINDPAEAARILAEIQKQYDATIELSERAFYSAKESMENVDQLISNTLEKI